MDWLSLIIGGVAGYLGARVTRSVMEQRLITVNRHLRNLLEQKDKEISVLKDESSLDVAITAFNERTL